jgi:threonine synthase
MKFHSTRGAAPVSLDQALVQGLAPDGGLYVAEKLPQFSLQDFADAYDIKATAKVLLTPFFEQSALRQELDDIIAETFSFPIPLTALPGDGGFLGLLELYHGPTAAFKDVGAGFLAACLQRIERGSPVPLTILVATSGDTGGAVAAAFNERSGMRVVVLFPKGRVSDRQAKQLTCWGDNVLSTSLRGSFDDSQALVKAAMADAELSRRHRFSSANSINVGRLLPQSIYFAHASLSHFRETGHKPSFIIPTGNLGNAFACIMARAMGLPIDSIVLATNENDLVVDYLCGAPWESRNSVATLASAMDVGNPSNMERLRNLLGDADQLQKVLSAVKISDAQIREQIRDRYKDFGFAICPHTATATQAYAELGPAQRSDADWIVAATAHPAKFEQIVEPLIGASVPLPLSLEQILSRPGREVSIDPRLDSLEQALDERFPA